MLVAVGGVPLTLQVVAQAVPLTQAKLDGQGAPVPAVQPPALLHVPAPAGVNVEPVHDAAPHEVLLVG